MPWSGLDSVRLRQGIWNRDLLQAAEEIWEAVQAGERSAAGRRRPASGNLLRMVVTRDPRVLKLAEQYFTLGDVLDIGKRVVGTGLIGGKAVGMLLARAILQEGRPALDRSRSNPTTRSTSAPTCSTRSWWRTAAGGCGRSSATRTRSWTAQERPGGGSSWAASPAHRAAVRGDAGLLRAVADHRPLQQPAGGQLRQRLRRQVRERVLREPGLRTRSGWPISWPPCRRSTPAR